MLKRVSALLLCILMLFCLLPAAALAADGEAEGLSAAFCNSDTEAAHDGVCWYTDTMRGGVLTASRPADPAPSCAGVYDGAFVTERLSEGPVDQLLWWEGRLLVSAGETLLCLDPESGAVLDSRRFEAPVARFAVSPAGLYVLTGGSVLLLTDGGERRLLSGVERFWLEDADTLCWMEEETTVHSVRLSDGSRSAAPNPVSVLPDEPAGEGVQGLGLAGLKQKFPHGRYWNHMPNRGTGMAYNNQNGWTWQACYKHNGYCGTAYQTCNGYAPYGQELSYQCWGFADKLGYDATGRDPQSLTQSYGWKKLWTSSSLSSLKAGDIVRYNKNGSSRYAHSIYVTGVSGDTVTYADCNYDGTCVIRWGQSISKSTLRSWFVFLLSAPSGQQQENQCLVNVNAMLDGKKELDTEGWAVFDVWRNGALYKTGVNDFYEYVSAGTSIEVKNVRPAEGVTYDAAASTAVSGTVSANRETLLILDHYYLNSAGERVKTTLADLPAQSDWSYRPVCWALENGISGGVSATSFGPALPCTRAQAVTFFWAFSGRPAAEGSLSFSDVSETDYFYHPVLWAVGQGITAGRSETSFAPDEVCSRAEAVTFLWKLAGAPAAELPEGGCPFSDVPEGSYFYHPVLWAVSEGLTAGVGEGRFAPELICSRAQILTFLWKLGQLQASSQ
ncbi:MAG: S-layer homology domain-containing protein [Oscillospiraceae bacterium]|nr:S-layer homology domain-containing protein [Oscillospiraceae bacterium]